MNLQLIVNLISGDIRQVGIMHLIGLFKKGYGFIQGEDGEDYFVHLSAVPKGTFLRENDQVTFEPVQTDRGKQAQNITLKTES